MNIDRTKKYLRTRRQNLIDGCKFMIFHKNGWFITYDESFKKIAEKHESSIGIFKNATGSTMIFIKNGWATTYDSTFKKISERHI